MGLYDEFRNESVFKVETRAMLEGLFLAWDKGFRKVKVECENALLVELLLFGEGASSSLVELQLLHQALRRKWKIRIRHIPITLNGVVDHMTKCADTCSSLIRLFRAPPASVMNLLGIDCNMSISF
ncbi:hypothetical protein Goklo_029171 [Gossypium klotzschianum]|uniref:RNase H type-1 domain-containing protein n=1 Tax=Gossypium klotzschianum TaxID=34286 RepID=A0A7J8W8J7_9ROSI|nr:hypothetical protein [Gossypium klotzschianum]